MERGPQLKVSSDRLLKPGIEPATPGLQGKQFIHYTTAAPVCVELVKLLPVHRYSVDIFSYSGPSGILGSDRKQNTA